MLSVSSYLIVVGVTEKSFKPKLLWTVPSFMDPVEKEASSREGRNKEPKIEILKSTNHLLPSVHSAVAAASPLFSSYRAALHSWKHSVPKLYKYQPSDIEVVVYRKNGDIEKLSHNKDFVLKKFPSNTEARSSTTVGINCHEEATSKVQHNEFFEEELPQKDIFQTGNEETFQEEAIPETSDKSVSNLDVCKNLKELNTVPLKIDMLMTQSPTPLEIPQVNCKFIFKTKGVSSVPSLQNRVQTFQTTTNDGYSQTIASNLTKIEKSTQVTPDYFCVATRNAECQCDCDDKAETDLLTSSTQVYHADLLGINHSNAECQCDYSNTVEVMARSTQVQHVDLLAVTHRNVECQCNLDNEVTLITSSTLVYPEDLFALTRQNAECQCHEVESISSSSQTDTFITQVNKLDFLQTFPEVVEIALQTDQPKAETLSSSAQTTSPTDSNTVTTNKVALHTVDWHTNVPCCNASNQTDSNSKNNFCQATPDMTSELSQVLKDDLNSTREVFTNTCIETKDVGVQLSASCCYFTKKRAKKQFDLKLKDLRKDLRKEIRSFYLQRQNEVVSIEENGKADSMLSVECNCNVGTGTACKKHLGIDDTTTPSSRQALQEATKYFDELGIEVDKLLGNTSMLKSNLESLEDTSYYEDDWLLNSN